MEMTTFESVQLSSSIEWGTEDLLDVHNINEFFENGCSCKLGKNKTPCIQQFSRNVIEKNISACCELSHDELDISIMGQLSALTNVTGKSIRFQHRGFVVCKDTFCFVNGIKKRRYESIRQHFIENGISVRQHGNKGRLPANTTPFEATHDVKIYIQEYAERNGLFLPGRTPGHRLDHDDTIYIPSHESKASVYREYVHDCENEGFLPVSYDVFACVWDTFLPHIHTIDPRSDLCFQCQQNNDLILRSANTEDEAKREAIRVQQEHLMQSDIQAKDYHHRIQLAKQGYLEVKPDFGTSRPPANSLPIASAYSFDFAQQVSYPSNPDQPGEIFFKAPRKVRIFGINNEVLNVQANYLIDEAVDTGKGANTVISYIHHYFENYGVGEQTMHLQVDNWQNKNNLMMQYLCWRVLCGLHSDITLNFMIAGHTKFSVDRCFGLFKRKYARMFCSSLFDIAETVNSSSQIGTNFAQLVGLPNGEVLVQSFD